MKLKLLTATLLILIALPSYASDLPPCPKDKTQTYHNCFGTETFTNGSKYVGEYKDDKRNGNGTYTWASGKVKSGIWADDEYLYDLAEHRRREENRKENDARTECAKEAGKANTEYAAKKIEEVCLEQKGYGKAWYEW